jgi:L-threonylcarbamoyladenylate synthase
MDTEIINSTSPLALPRAIDVLQRGDLVAFPTDTVYGLGALAFNAQAIERLYIAKDRPSEKAIAVLVGDTDALYLITSQMNDLALRLARRFWPGPLTLVVPRQPSLPENISSRFTIGVRMPDHPVALDLLRQVGPLAVTSANLSGKASACTAQEVYNQLAGRIPLILDGGLTPGGTASTVVDCTGDRPVILRPGPITAADVEATLI